MASGESTTVSGVTLYWFPGTCARVPLVALEEIGQAFDAITVNLFHDRERYKLVNPKGKVPALVVDGRLITEVPAISTYLAERHPGARLLPAGDRDLELDVLSTMSWFAGGIHAALPRLRFPHLFSEGPESHEGIRAIARRTLEECFAILECRLEGREWLYDEWSIVDAFLLWLWFRATGSGMDGSPFPNCIHHAQRCEQRPSVVRALDREEQELARIVAAGDIPSGQRPYQVGRAPEHGRAA